MSMGNFYALDLSTGATVWWINGLFDYKLLANYGALTMLRSVYQQPAAARRRHQRLLSDWCIITWPVTAIQRHYVGSIAAVDIDTHAKVYEFLGTTGAPKGAYGAGDW